MQPKKATLLSEITCPNCGGMATEEMPENACVFLYECKACGAILRPND